ncbi:MAG: malto-oligosyltrehalose trehalohydrolase [Spirochaetaceae bacterium]|nr:MAG: malto-oligosyltrehalose trehalohydrolase [Spirochaetaceae bacterium]
MTTGSTYRRRTGASFCVWAPLKQSVELKIVSPGEMILPMEMDSSGYWTATIAEAEPGLEYFYRLDGTTDRPDPASRLQQRGVHGPSTLVDLSLFEPDDPRYTPLPFADHVIYELHVGAFTVEGTLQAAAGRLDYLAELGVTAVELMPLAHFPGNRNWGYDGVYPYAVHTAYGGPAGLAGFVAEAHRRGIAVILDVVYNHLGPEGNYLSDFGPYLSAHYETPWGRALNFDGPYSDEVRRFFLENVRQWLELFHIDGLRLDAVHAMIDTSATPILAEMSELTERISLHTGKNRFLIAESLMNDSRVIRSRTDGGLGMTAEWLDDLHHALHARVTGERSGYYADFGDSEMVEASLSQAYALSRRYSRYWRRTFGNSALDCAPEQFVSYIQNHDQIGNRADGARIAALVPFEAQKMLAAVILLGPFVPMLFMGEEYGETAPFEYFVSHSDPDLVAAVREGRLAMFGDSRDGRTPADPQAPSTYAASRIRPEEAESPQQKALLKLYRRLISLRSDLRSRDRDDPIPPGSRLGLHSAYSVERNDDIIAVSTRTRDGLIIILINLGEHDETAEFASGHLSFHCMLDTAAVDWAGPGQANPPYISEETAIRVRAQSVILLSQE